ncbi:MAG: hypothetical protein ACLTQG_30720 [Hungatella sp.]|uniref:hypothetical protein n=1 Tax=Hungatella sp. TaxID=2613924 RepID=UPI00399641DB
MRMRNWQRQLLLRPMAVSMLAGCGGSGKTGASSAAGSSAEAGKAAFGNTPHSSPFPEHEINDGNEIQAAIADITGARVKETLADRPDRRRKP